MSDPGLLAGQTALVTGAGAGIGRAIAEAYAAAGARVLVNDLDPTRCAEVSAHIRAAGGDAAAIAADVADAREVARMAAAARDAAGTVDILVNNAGISLVKPFLELTEADWDRVLGADLKSVFLTTRALVPGMLAKGAGAVINIASELGYLGRARFTAYCAAKGGVIALTRALARELAPDIRVNAIAPGPVATDMLEAELVVTGAREAETAIPAGRLGRPGEIAATAVFLASGQASFYYGDVLSPSGGALMR